jgi:hypothetical protein
VHNCHDTEGKQEMFEKVISAHLNQYASRFIHPLGIRTLESDEAPVELTIIQTNIQAFNRMVEGRKNDEAANRGNFEL